jgi:hypothetical protein
MDIWGGEMRVVKLMDYDLKLNEGEKNVKFRQTMG